jgi:hypothetical protein
MAPRTLQMPEVPTGAERPTVLMRVYPGRHEAAVEWAQRDAEELVDHGYHPVGQSYAQGSYGLALAFIGVLLCPVGIGFVILLAMAAMPAAGSLAVTYELRDSAAAPVQ